MSVNRSPLADAGADQTVHAGSVVTLDGTSSTDPDLDYPLTYQWSLVSRPEGSSAELGDPTTGRPSFFADLAGEYVVSLTVSDGVLSSDPSNVVIAATSSGGEAIEVLRAAVDAINRLPPESFKNPHMANVLTRKIAAVIWLIERGRYVAARLMLHLDIMAKTEGCATTGAPGRNDWITDCTSQAQVYLYLLRAITLLQQLRS